MIEVRNLTMKYSSGKGIFDLDFAVKEGEVMGYLGPNGAGKTTTIRVLLGFMYQDRGVAKIDNMDCWKDAPKIQRRLGYIPGEIAFLDGMSGDEFLRFIQNMRGTRNLSRQKELLEMFELNPKGKIKKFSKGMKQKLGIITAFMHNPDVLILDEPTSGLDPLMQNRFTELINSEKANGKTILMSSHMFEEIEKTCDSVLIIKEGRIVKQSSVQALKATQRKAFILKTDEADKLIQMFKATKFEIGNITNDSIEVFVTGDDTDKFIKIISNYKILNLDLKQQTLDDIFMQFYSKEEK
jgi:ABC-2 type transport system ATP-binding protein